MAVKKTKSHLDWWQQARFGMFIHWGLYSITARDMWYYSQEKVPKEKYEQLAKRFNPVDYNPEEWAELAVEAGMKYAVITTKHHDGYCLFDSKLTDFKATNSPCKRDLIADWAKAFHAAGLRTGFYYSLLDWHHPHYVPDPCHPQRDDEKAKKEKRVWSKYVEYLHGQVKEILTKYGKVDILWADFSWQDRGPKDWDAERLVKMARSINPDIIMNDRLGIPLDFKTPEQYIPDSQPMVDGKPRPWETCMTIGQSWGYYRQDARNKTTAQIIRTLVECVSKGGNLLLNVGPTPKGTIQDEFIVKLLEVGRWMRENGESIYGCGTSEFTPPPGTRYTQKGDKLYLHIFDYPPTWMILPGLYGKVEYATLISDGTDIGLKTDDNMLALWLPALPPDEIDTVIELQLNGK